MPADLSTPLLDVPEDPFKPVLGLTTTPLPTLVLHLTNKEDTQDEDTQSWDLSQVSQPTLRREGDAGLTGASSKEGRRAESLPTFIRGKRQKNKNMWSMNFNRERFGSFFYAQGRY